MAPSSACEAQSAGILPTILSSKEERLLTRGLSVYGFAQEARFLQDAKRRANRSARLLQKTLLPTILPARYSLVHAAPESFG